MKKVLFVLIACALFLASCNSPAATPTAMPEVSTVQPTVDLTSQVQPTSTSVPIDKNMATVSGTLVRKDTDPVRPYARLKLYLGTILIGNDGKSTLARVNPNTAPYAYTDENGYFIVHNVPPGEYILVASLPPNNMIKLKNPDTGAEMIFEVTAGQLLELGVLAYDFVFEEVQVTTPQPYPEPGAEPVEPTAYPAP